MALKKAFVAGSAFLLLAGQVAAQTKGKPAAAKPATTKTTSASIPAPVKVTSVEGITEYRLANGMQVLLMPDNSKPTVTVNVTYKVGSRHEGYGESGMAHLLEHMVFKGSPKHKNIPAELTEHGASPNGTTSDDRTNYFETFAATDENLNWALDMESDRMMNSFIAEEALRSEFTVVRNEFESGENSPSRVLMERVLSTAYLWHNYGKSTIGSKDDIEKVPIQNLQAFYHKYYQPDNAVVIVAGKMDEPKTLELVNKYFGGIPRPERKLTPTYTVEPQQDGERFVELRRVGDIQSVSCAFHIPSGIHQDYPALDVLATVLTDEPNGRLYQSLVKGSKATSAWGFADGKHDAGYMYFNADVAKEKSLDDAKATMFGTLDELKTKPVTAEEVEKAKSSLMKSFETAYRNTGRVGLLLSEFVAQGDWRMGFIYRDNLKKVTAADVNRVASAYIMASNRTTGVFIPTANPTRATIPASPDVASLVNGYKGQQALAAGEDFDASPDNIDKRTTVINMTSGAKYSMLTKVNRGNTVEARITLRLGDEASMMNKGTISELTAQMLKRGTTKHTMAQINETLDKLQSSVNIGAGGQTVSISIQSTRKDFPAVMDLVTEILHSPAFGQDEFKTIVAENLAGIEEQRSEPQTIARREYSRMNNHFPKGHVFYAMSVDEEAEAVKVATLDDVKKFYKDYYNGSSATGAIVGDFDAEVAKQHMNSMLDNWAAVKSYTRIANPYVASAPNDKDFITPDKKNAVLICGLNLKMKDDHPDYAAITMANFIFGGGFLNSRLAVRIRQKEGISYGVGSQFAASSVDENGSFSSFAIYNPDNRDKLMAAYKEELNKFINEGITEDELKAAKSGMGQYRTNGRANDGAVAGKLNSNVFLGRKMAWDKAMDDKLQSLTVAEVNAALKKNLDASKLVYIKAGDFKKS